MTINNVPFQNAGVNMMSKSAEKTDEVPDDERAQQKERDSVLQKLQKKKSDYENAMTDSPLGAEAVQISESVE